MSKKIRINVTQRDIALGVRQSTLLCPLARAVRRHWKVAAVYRTCVFVGNMTIFLPAKARNFIYRVDEGLAVTPIRFMVEVPDVCSEAAGRSVADVCD